MHPKNREKFDFAGILSWHEAGYTGRGVTVATLERETSEHGQMTADIIRQVAPGATILFRKVPGINAKYGKLTPNSVERMEEFYHSLIAEGVHIVTMSKDGTSAENIADLEEGILHAGGVTMVTSAGNEGREIRATEAAALDTWIAVGAANIINSQPKRARYSNTGANLDVMGFSELYTAALVPFDGTSASAPFVAGMLALWFERFYEVNGRYPTHQESYEFCATNTVDMEDKGFDEKTGYGLFILPRPESIGAGDTEPDIKWVGSPHFWRGRTKGGVTFRPIAIVNHTMAGTLAGTDAWFNNSSAKVSAHFGVGRQGEIHQYVDVADTAWANGDVDKPDWPLLITGVNPNLYTVSIEHEGYPDQPLAEAQYAATLWLHRQLLRELGITPSRDTVIGHYRINSIDKANCPGPLFPWDRLFKDLGVVDMTFKDVPAGHWAESAVKKAADEGIISGFGDDTFRGDEPLTRYQMAAVIANLLDWVKKGGK